MMTVLLAAGDDVPLCSPDFCCTRTGCYGPPVPLRGDFEWMLWPAAIAATAGTVVALAALVVLGLLRRSSGERWRTGVRRVVAPAVVVGAVGAMTWVMARVVVGVLDQSVWAFAAAAAVLAAVGAVWAAQLVRERRHPPDAGTAQAGRYRSLRATKLSGEEGM